MSIRISEITFVPNPLVAGKEVKATCKIESDAEITSVYVYDPRDWTLKMYDDGTHGDEVAQDGVYTLVERIPYDAEAGTYHSTIVVTDKNSNAERQTIEFRVA